MIIYNLLLINLIMVLVHESGFISHVDEWVSSRWRFRHLPYPVLCCLCGVWWLSLLYIIVTGNLTLPGVALCLANAHLTKIVTPLVRMVENMVLKVIGLVNDWLNL